MQESIPNPWGTWNPLLMELLTELIEMGEMTLSEIIGIL